MVQLKSLGLALPVGALLGMMLVGCAEILDIPPELELIDSGPWRCLESSPNEAPVNTAAAGMAEVRVQACDFISNCTEPVTNLTARLCDKRDIGCNAPRLTGLRDDGGLFRFEVPTAGAGFDGYLEVLPSFALCTDTTVFGDNGPSIVCQYAPACNLEAPDASCNAPTYGPAMLFFNPPVMRDIEAPIPLQLFPAAGLPSLVEAAGAAMDPNTGSVVIQALDCDGRPARGVTYNLAQPDERATALYLSSGVLSRAVPETDSSGLGGFVRVKPGTVIVSGLAESAAVGQIGVQALPSFVTYTALVPTPPP